MKYIPRQNNWRQISQFEIDAILPYAQDECRYHKVSYYLYIALLFFFVPFVVIAVSFISGPLSSWSDILAFVCLVLFFALLIMGYIYSIVLENRKLKQISAGEVRCINVIVSRKRIRTRRSGGSVHCINVYGLKTGKKSPNFKEHCEYEVSGKTYKKVNVKDRGLLVRFDKDEDDKNPSKYRFFPLNN